jgi:hypothetical protein
VTQAQIIAIPGVAPLGEDLRSVLHAHTTASDGADTLEGPRGRERPHPDPDRPYGETPVPHQAFALQVSSCGLRGAAKNGVEQLPDAESCPGF